MGVEATSSRSCGLRRGCCIFDRRGSMACFSFHVVNPFIHSFSSPKDEEAFLAFIVAVVLH